MPSSDTKHAVTRSVCCCIRRLTIFSSYSRWRLYLKKKAGDFLIQKGIDRLNRGKKYMSLLSHLIASMFVCCIWLLLCLSVVFLSRSGFLHSYGDVIIAGEWLQGLGLCSAPTAFEYREGSLSCYTCCDTGPRVLRSHPKDRPLFYNN